MQTISTSAVRTALLRSENPEFRATEGVEDSEQIARACRAFWIAAMRRVLDGEAAASALNATREEMIDGGRSAVRSSEAMEFVRPLLADAVARADAVIRAALELDGAG